MKVWFGILNFDTLLLVSRDSMNIFQNRFLYWHRDLKPVVLSTMNPINGTKIFLSYKGGCRFLKSRTPQLNPLKIEKDINFPKTYIIYPNNYYQPNWKWDFFNFQPTLLFIPVQLKTSNTSIEDFKHFKTHTKYIWLNRECDVFVQTKIKTCLEFNHIN